MPRRVAKSSERSSSKPVRTARRVAKPEGEPKAKAKPRPRRVAKRKPTVQPSDKTIILALSPRAANTLRVVLARSRAEEEELKAVLKELEDQLGVTDASWVSKKERAR